MLHLLNSFIASKRLHTIDLSKPRKEIIGDLNFVYYKLKEIDVEEDITEKIREHEKILNQKTDDTLDHYEREELKINIRIWSSIIESHFKKIRMIEPSELGTLNHDQLYEISQEGSSSFFGYRIWNTMSDIEKNDFSEAAKCLLMKCWTAAAMISLRGLEGILRKYYEFKTEKKHENRGMYILIDELQKIEDIKDTLMGYLHYLRGIRNMAEHPDRVFNQTEAETVFIQVVGAVKDIYQEIN